MQIPFKVDTHIRVDKSLLSNEIKEDLKDFLSVEPPFYGADHLIFTFYDEDTNDIILPRGFLSRFEEGLKRSGLVPVRATDYAESAAQWASDPIQLRPHQVQPVNDITSGSDFTGIYQAPPGSGKTATALECIRRSGECAIVLVDRASVADQWIERAEQFLGITPAKIGEGIFEVGDLTIAMKQTLWAKLKTSKDQLTESWFSQWGFVVVDECHAIQASTYQNVIQKFRPKYLLGLSATPHKKDGMEKVVELMLGNVELLTESDSLPSGILISPEVRCVASDLNLEYKAWEYRGVQRNNYSSLLKHLVEDLDRNNLIAQTICSSPNKKRLLVTKRLKHIDILEKLVSELDSEITVLRLTGKETSQERIELISSLDNLDNFLVLSTVADEAIDIPPIDAVFNVFPVRNTDLLKQIIGRGERACAGKNSYIFYDFYDPKSNIFNNQFSDRLHYYKSRNYDVKFA